MRVQPNIIVSIAKKDDFEVFEVISMFRKMTKKVIEIWLNYVLDVMKSIRHSSLEGVPDIIQARREIFIGKSPPHGQIKKFCVHQLKKY